MPISKEEFERGRTLDSLTDQVYSFLTVAPDQAFTAEEIAVGVGYAPDGRVEGFAAVGRYLTIANMQTMLNEWAKRGLIESKDVEGADGYRQRYFSAKKATGEVRWDQR